MHMTRSLLLVGLCAAAAALPAQAEVKLGTFAGTEVGFEGLFQVDGNWYDNDGADLDGRDDDRDRATGVRRAEFVLKGDGPGPLDWTVGYDVESEKYLDVNIGLTFDRGDSGTHALRIGQFKHPNSLEELSSTKNNDFIAKAAATSTFAIARRLGVGYSWDAGDRGVSASWFGRELTSGEAEGAGFGARGYWAPVRDDGHVLHLGLAHVDRDTPDDTLRLRARPNADLASARLVDTGSFADADRVATTSLEAMWIRGPVKLQGEWYQARVDRLSARDYDGGGGYASAMWNPGGATWGYRGGLPRTPSAGDGNGGLWQFGLRFDHLDLDDGSVRGGRMDAWTLGANWYWREHAKLMLNYVRVDSERAGIADDPGIVEARIQFHW
jgi:phosphate-selective porin OprO and OprP